MKKGIVFKIFTGVFLLVIIFMGCAEAVMENISEEIIRLHIVANSNDPGDQEVKIKVRDKILEWGKEVGTLNLELALERKEEILLIANAVLEENGYPYHAKIETGRFYFPTKKYENIALPAGEYNAVRIVLGEGKGENWWCVMYPPLCFSDSAKGKISGEDRRKLSDMIGKAELYMIEDEKIVLKPCFRVVEIWESIKEKGRELLGENKF